MATPLGHSLLGIAVTRLYGGRQSIDRKYQIRWLLFSSLAACAPDFDFLPGLFAGDINLYHQGPSHSVVAALIFAMFSLVFVQWLNARAGLVAVSGALAYASHLLLDFFCYDGRPPYGQPLLWPFSEGHWIASETIFSGIRHGVPGDGFVDVMMDIISYSNIHAIGLEIGILLPVLLIAWFLRKRIDHLLRGII